MVKLLSELLQDLQLPALAIHALTLDSRTVEPGSLFFAYPGFEQDGRDYISEAIERQAAAILYEQSEGFVCPPAENTLLIPNVDVRKKVGPIAACFYDHPSQGMNIIGVTGTNGKTSITHFIAEILSKAQRPCAVIGTLGNGLLTALSKPTHTTPTPIELQQELVEFKQAGITEVAMEVSSHALHQARVAGLAFQTGVFTQLSRDHLDYHQSLEAYAEAKELLFQQPGLKNAVINADDSVGEQFIAKYRSQLEVVIYSLNPARQAKGHYLIARSITSLPIGFLVELDTSWGSGQLRVPMLGLFNVSNMLAVLGVLLLNKMPLEQALAYCAELSAVRGRMQIFGNEAQPKVVVDYAHTPDALEKALSALRAHCKGNVWCVFGCGGNRDQGKRPQMGSVAEKLSDYIVITNDNPRNEAGEKIAAQIKQGMQKSAVVQVILNRAEAIQTVVQSAKINDIVLIAGKGHETTQVIDGQMFPFDDAEHVKQALARRN